MEIRAFSNFDMGISDINKQGNCKYLVIGYGMLDSTSGLTHFMCDFVD